MLANDLAAVLEQLDLGEATLVGQSLGCGEMVRYLSRHGANRVARMVLVSTITPLVLKTDDNPDGVDLVTLENGSHCTQGLRNRAILSCNFRGAST